MFYAHLYDRTIIALSGDDRISFLQGLITNDAEKLAQGETLYAALLSPQGKFLHDFFVIPEPERILVDVNKDRANDLLARLKIYKLRSKVTIEPLELQVTAIWPHAPQGVADPRLPALGSRSYGDVDVSSYQMGDYAHHRISLGVPDGAKDMHIDKSLPLEFGLDKLHGVSFSKGCYVGQEVTARSKFRGQVRKALYCVSSAANLPPLGTPVVTSGKEVGELRSVSGSIGLALLRIEEVENTQAPLMAGGIAIRAQRPEWHQ